MKSLYTVDDLQEFKDIKVSIHSVIEAMKEHPHHFNKEMMGVVFSYIYETHAPGRQTLLKNIPLDQMDTDTLVVMRESSRSSYSKAKDRGIDKKTIKRLNKKVTNLRKEIAERRVKRWRS